MSFTGPCNPLLVMEPRQKAAAMARLNGDRRRNERVASWGRVACQLGVSKMSAYNLVQRGLARLERNGIQTENLRRALADHPPAASAA